MRHVKSIHQLKEAYTGQTTILKKINGRAGGSGAHAYNLSYSGHRDRKGSSLRPTSAKMLVRPPISNNKPDMMGHTSVIQYLGG
jgi:hypothetical protein